LEEEGQEWMHVMQETEQGIKGGEKKKVEQIRCIARLEQPEGNIDENK
jgi:hypothetical protein